jgi:hypothetical protein
MQPTTKPIPEVPGDLNRPAKLQRIDADGNVTEYSDGIRQYLADIGRRGGEACKGRESAKIRSQKAVAGKRAKKGDK